MDISIVAPINQLGYGICSLNILKALSRENKVGLYPLGEIQAAPSYHKTIQQSLDNYWSLNPTSPCLRIWHQHDMTMWFGRGLHVGYPIFELNKFTPVELNQLTIPHVLTVASGWAADILIKNGLSAKRIRVAPLGVDNSVFYPVETINDGVTRFLSIGKWEIRKGHDVLSKAFKAAFGDDPSVELIMNCSNPFLNKEQTAQWERLYSAPNIRIIKQRLTSQTEVARLMNSVDCGVFPARAEGWNLEALEMLACGKQVIATDYAGHTEFLNKENALLIKVDNLEDSYDGIWFKGQGQWAAIEDNQIKRLVNHMRLVCDLKNGGNVANEAGLETAKRYTWDKTAADLVGVFNERYTD